MRLRAPLTLLTLAPLVAVGVAMSAGTAYAAAPVLDGSTRALAAKSCWAIKQAAPAKPSGVYWLQTSKLVTAQQFYCDQVTDGGGWVLIGRGREGWAFTQRGQGSPAAVHTTISGPAAFAPAALPAETIDGLIDGASMAGLADGIRVRRATNTAGTAYQEVRLKLAPLAAGSTQWSWAFGGGHKLASTSFDGAASTLTNQSTRDWSFNGADDSRRVFTFEWEPHQYRAGWAYGASVTGNNTSTSYLWQATNEARAIPFTQVWLRPQLGNGAFPAVPTTGTPATSKHPLMKTTTSNTTPWGVTGVVGGGTGETNLEVQALTPLGHTMYVGGKFESVQKGPNPAAGEKVAQPYLAAFNSDTGEWKPGFRPQLDGQVWDIQATPDGYLIVAGEFSNVNGAPDTRGLAKLDPNTGAVVASWKASLAYGAQPTSVKGRALDIQGDWLYVGGAFTSVTGGVATPRTVKLRNATRVKLSDGTPDGAWKPGFNKTVIELDASDRGDRVYFAGKFTPDPDPNFIQANGAAVISTSTGALVPGVKPYQPSTVNPAYQYQQTVREVGNEVWLGGSQHNMHRYSRDTFDLERSTITKRGGDMQASVVIDGVLYASCHCVNHIFTGTNDYDNGYPITSAFGSVYPITYIGAWDLATGEYLPEFAISGLDTRAGNGPWDLTKDANGCLWFGGDMTQGSWTGSQFQWLGGFGKVCPRDSQAPTTPGALKGTRTATGVNLTWSAATDNVGVAGYELLKDDRVILTTTALRYTDTGAEAGSKYWIRAIDAEGNRSASSPVIEVAAASDPTTPRPAAPAITQVDSGAGSLSVHWSPSTGTGVTGYRAVATPGEHACVATAASATGCVVSGLANLTEYSVTVVATGAVNSDPSAAVKGTPAIAPARPTKVKGVAGTSSVTVSWTPPSNLGSGVAKYRVIANPGPATCESNGTSCVIGAVAGTAYTYTVVAVGRTGAESAPSDPSAAVTVAKPASAARTSTTPAGLLAVTGLDLTYLITTGLVLIMTGTAGVLAGRRRRSAR